MVGVVYVSCHCYGPAEVLIHPVKCNSWRQGAINLLVAFCRVLVNMSLASIGICVSQVGEHISLEICVSQVGKHTSSETQGQLSGSGEKAGRKFSSKGKRAPGYRLSPRYFQNSSGCRLLIGHKKCFVLLCPIGEQFLLSSFHEFVHDGYCLTTLARFVPQACACKGNFYFLLS